MELPDFDYLKLLANEDPEALERLRRLYCEKLIGSAPLRYRDRLQGLQFQIDMIKRRSKNPLHSCIEISKMMMDNYFDMQQVIMSIDNSSNRILPEKPCYSNNIVNLFD